MIPPSKQLSIYTQLSNKYNVPYQVVEVICNSPFKFAKEVMLTDNLKDIMFAYLFKLKLKRRAKDEISKKLSGDTEQTGGPETADEVAGGDSESVLQE